MGTPLPPNEPASDCSSCWGPSKPFGDGPTPRVVQLRLTRMLPGEFFTEDFEQFLLRTHYLTQFTTPCHYRIESFGFRMDVLWFDTFTVVQVAHLPTARQVFDQTGAPLCSLDLTNGLTGPIGTIMFHGFANITWDLGGLD